MSKICHVFLLDFLDPELPRNLRISQNGPELAFFGKNDDFGTSADRGSDLGTPEIAISRDIYSLRVERKCLHVRTIFKIPENPGFGHFGPF